jgi:hypothetical protein
MSEALDDYRWLVSPEGLAWLQEARELASASVSLIQLVARLRKNLSLRRAHLVAEQLELRKRAAEKFSQADKLFFTKKGLEQATDEALGRYKAERFATGARVADVCCGIGGDLLSLASRGPTIGIDSDPVAALLAETNLIALEFRGSRVEVADAAAADYSECSAWHCDPDRRPGGERTTNLEHFAPDLAQLEALVKRMPDGAIKLAPATIAPEAWAEATEREWLGSRGECRQQVAWFGALARHPGKRAATIVERGERRTVVERPEAKPVVAAKCGRYVFEPHNAVLAAQLTSSLCQEYGLGQISAAVAYLTGDTKIDDSALDAFEVVEVLPLDRKRLKTYCREHGLGRLVIKKRGVDIEPDVLRKEVSAEGEGAATIIVTPIGGRIQALITRRIGQG